MLKNKGTGSYHFFTDVQQSSDAWQNYVIPNDTLQQVSISTSISVVNDGFSFTGGSGNWSGSNIIYIAVGDPQ